MSRERQIARRSVIEVVVRGAADDRITVGKARHSGEMLADECSRYCRGNCANLAANFRRGVGLGVPGFELALAAARVDENHRLGPPKAGKVRRRTRSRSDGSATLRGE